MDWIQMINKLNLNVEINFCNTNLYYYLKERKKNNF